MRKLQQTLITFYEYNGLAGREKAQGQNKLVNTVMN